ncbi:MAG: hypothetical protein GY730_06020 [bacterium]|nr:hypothetical protein [bacterium]
MNRINFKLFILILIFLNICGVLQISGQEIIVDNKHPGQKEVPSKNNRIESIQNEFIKIIVNNGPEDLGRFAVETVGGDPQNPGDNNNSLIFGRPIPWTSYTTVWIDGEAYVFGGINRKIEKRAGKKVSFGEVIYHEVTADRIITECAFGKIQVVQELYFARNPITRVRDMASVSYSIKNEGEKDTKVGIRIMLDTKLGANDGAPFRIGDKAITSEIKFLKKDLFDYWQTFDNLTSPNIIAQGILKLAENGVNPPDRMCLVNWGTLADNPWEFDYEEGRSFIRLGEFEKDTALALYWDPVLVSKGDSFSVKTLYGLGGITLSPGSLSLGITAPAEMYSTSKKEILIMGYILNSGGFDSRDTVVSIGLPEGFKVVNGKTLYDLEVLFSGESRQIPVKVILDNPSAGMKKIQLKVTSATLDKNETYRQINILSPPTIKAQLILPPEKIITYNEYFDAIVALENHSTGQIDDVYTRIKLDKNLSLPDFEIPRKIISTLEPGQKKNIDWKVKVKNKNAVENNLGVEVKSSVTASKKYSEYLKIKTPAPVVRLIPSKENLKVNDYFYLMLQVDNAKAFHNTDISIDYDGELVEDLRQSPEFWLRKDDQISRISHQPDKISLSQINNDQEKSILKICKFHFKALKKGRLDFLIRKNEEVIKKLTLTIN